MSVCVAPIVARQRLGKDVTAATNTHATIELLDASFFMPSVSYEKNMGDWFFPEFILSSAGILGLCWVTPSQTNMFLRNDWSTTIEEMLEAVFSVVHVAAVAQERVINRTSLELSSLVRLWPAGNGVSTEAEESPLLEAVIGK
jgi:hypothetical protein